MEFPLFLSIFPNLRYFRSVCDQKDPTHRSDKEIHPYTEYRSGQRYTLSQAHFD